MFVDTGPRALAGIAMFGDLAGASGAGEKVHGAATRFTQMNERNVAGLQTVRCTSAT
jgi:Protein of unknown function (DUF2563)